MEAADTPRSGADFAIFLNPASGSGNGLRRWKRFLDSPIADRMSLSNAEIFEPQTSSESLPDQADRWVADKTEQGITKFIAAGGDGTVNTLINSLLKQPKAVIDNIVIGAIALGSSNDFHKDNDKKAPSYKGISYRLNFQDSEKHDIVSTDLGKSEVKFFVINASLGITAEANRIFSHTSRWTKPLQAISTQMSIMLAATSAFIRHQSLAISVERDGSPEPTVTLINNMGLIKNRHFAGNFKYNKSQAPDNGKMGVFICSGMNKLQILTTMAKLLTGKFPRSSNTKMFETSNLKMTSKSPFVIELDGETYVTSSASFQVLPRKLHICP